MWLNSLCEGADERFNGEKDVGFVHPNVSGLCIHSGQLEMTMAARKTTLQQRVALRVRKSTRDVFLTRDFEDISGEDQVIRALRALVEDRMLLRLGKGVYAKARPSSLSGKAVLANPGGFLPVAKQALERLGVKVELTDAQRAFAEDRSTQMPVNPVLKVKGRFSRKLRYGKSELIIER